MIEIYKPRPWIGVDLDGTMAEWTKDSSFDEVGKPIIPMINKVKRWVLEENKEVKIFTARVSRRQNTKFKNNQVDMITRWCIANLGFALPITAEKDTFMMELWDDIAVPVERNTGRAIVPAWSSNG